MAPAEGPALETSTLQKVEAPEAPKAISYIEFVLEQDSVGTPKGIDMSVQLTEQLEIEELKDSELEMLVKAETIARSARNEDSLVNYGSSELKPQSRADLIESTFMMRMGNATPPRPTAAIASDPLIMSLTDSPNHKLMRHEPTAEGI